MSFLMPTNVVHVAASIFIIIIKVTGVAAFL